jgi:hypothetical protein
VPVEYSLLHTMPQKQNSGAMRRKINEEIIEWLLEGDPSIRWQVMRDIIGSSKEAVAKERARIAREGWGAKLLSYQGPSGRWAGQLYHHKWVSTTYTLILLRRMGLEQDNTKAHKACKELLDGGFRENGGITYAKSAEDIDNGVAGMVLSLLAYFGYPDERIHSIVEYLLTQQMPDGRWDPTPSIRQIRYSLDCTILILEGLREYEKRYPQDTTQVIESQKRGQEFLLRHKLYRFEDTGEIIYKKMTLFSFPPRWHYDVLMALDYFQECGAERDERLSDAIELLRKKRRKDGTWSLQNRHPGRTFFEMEEAGKPSRWNTLRALRVIHWWESHQ